MKRKAFTLLELLVVIGIIGILVGILAPQLGKMMAKAKRTRCLTNLKAISTGMGAYKADNDDRMPVMRRKPASDAAVNAAPDAGAGADEEYASGDDTADDPATTDVDETSTREDWVALGDQAMQNVWLMIMSGDLKDNVFRCPADKDYSARQSDYNFGWNDPKQYSYGIQWPYAYAADGTTKNKAAFSSDLDGSVTTFADMLPDQVEGSGVGADFTNGEEPMHGKLGFNFLAGDTPQEYSSKVDSDAGYAGDDIYLGGSGQLAGGMPGGTADTGDDYDAKRDSAIALGGRTDFGDESGD